MVLINFKLKLTRVNLLTNHALFFKQQTNFTTIDHTALDTFVLFTSNFHTIFLLLITYTFFLNQQYTGTNTCRYISVTFQSLSCYSLLLSWKFSCLYCTIHSTVSIYTMVQDTIVVNQMKCLTRPHHNDWTSARSLITTQSV